MKKILLSAAVIALSGAYVAYEDHGAAPSLAAGMAAVPSAAYVAPAVVKPEALTPTFDQAPSPVAPPRAPTSAELPAAPAAPKPATKVASAAPKPAAEIASAALPVSASESANTIGSIIADAAPTPSADKSEAASGALQPAAVMPLPLPRPADAPQSSAATASTKPQSMLRAQTVAATQGMAQVQGAYRNGTYKGVSANAYYGRVQVEAIVSNGRLASIRMLDYPRDRRRSLYIAQRSLPALEREAISAQSANIDAVSGATLTSRAFIKSLDSALSRAQGGGGNA